MLWISLIKLLINTKKSVGPRAVPWGISDMTLHGDKKQPSITTCCDQLDKNDLIH